MTVVNILDVSSKDLSKAQLWGCNIDLALSRSQNGVHALSIIGWVLGRSSPAVNVEIVSGGMVIGRVPVEIHRPDIAAVFPDILGAEQSGFQIALDLSEMPSAFDLLVQAVFEDGSRIQTGIIRGQHSSPCGEAQIEEITTTSTELSALLWGCNIDLPVAGSHSEVYAIDVEGWVLGRSSPAITVEFMDESSVVRRIPINVPRPDIVAQYPAVSEAKNSGFRAMVSILGLTPEFELSVRAVLQDGNRIPMGIIRGQRSSLNTGFQPRLQPLMLTTLGRTGSTWAMRLLGQHPGIVAYRPFTYEPRVSTYWMHVLKTLSNPVSYLQPIAGSNKVEEYWWIGNTPSSDVPEMIDIEVHKWLGGRNIEVLLAFCQGRIEAFYEHVATTQNQLTPVYFAEKYIPDYFVLPAIWELYVEAREVFLVRDFRDVVCSILAFNAQRGYSAFGRELATSDEQYIRQLRGSAVLLLRSWKQRNHKAHLLRYEDLILHPVEELHALLEYLGLDSTPATVEGMIERASEETLGMQRHRTIPDPERSIGRWRRDLDASLQAACQEAFGDILEEFGYME